MLFPEKMLRATITIEAGHSDEVLDAIGRRGVLHIDRQEHQLRYASEESRVKTLRSLVKKYMRLLGIEPLRRRIGSVAELREQLERTEEQVAEIGGRIDTLDARLKDAERESERFRSAAALKTALAPLIDSAVLVRRLRFLKMRLAMVTMEGSELLRLAMQERGVLLVDQPMYEETNAVALIYEEALETGVAAALGTVKANEIPPGYVLSGARNAQRRLHRELLREKEDLADAYREALQELDTRLEALTAHEAAKSALREAEGCVILEGWIPGRSASAFEGLEHARVSFRVPEGEAPVLIVTPPALKPFERLIANFAYPRYGEVNPVLPFAFSFLLLFGIMFGDVGHGLLLASAGWSVKRFRSAYADLGQIYFLSGISSTLFGLLYGSIFGVHHLLPHLLFTPIENIWATILFSIGIGIMIITFSFLLHIVTAVKRREPTLLFVSEGSLLWLLVYWFTIGILVKSMVQELDITYEMIALVLLLLAILVLALRREHQKSQAFIDLVREYMDTITNTLSFLRVGAFAMAHGALFMAVFSIARMISESQGESVGYWLSIIVGNIVIIVLEGIVVTIQTLRLEYYEFFKRFFKGGGLPYRPYSVGGNDAE